MAKGIDRVIRAFGSTTFLLTQLLHRFPRPLSCLRPLTSPHLEQCCSLEDELQATCDTNTTRSIWAQQRPSCRDRAGQSPIFNNNLRTPAVHRLDGDARKR
ncbi:MAG: hypothetical protein ACKO3T_23920, partial [Planctomycetaceae bacterium]